MQSQKPVTEVRLEGTDLDPVKKHEVLKNTVFRAKMVELTFSQCEVAKEDALRHLQDIYGEKMRRYQIARETHSGAHGPSGSHHLHVFLECENTVEHPIKKLEKTFGRRPHVARVRSPASFLGYILKEDKKPLGNFDALMEGMSYSGKKDLLLLALVEAGWTMDRILIRFPAQIWPESFPSYYRKCAMFLNAKRKRQLCAKIGNLRSISRQDIENILSKQELEEFDSFDGYAKIVRHINDIVQYAFRQKPFTDKTTLLLVGKSGVGKTRLVSKISDFAPTYLFPLENWHPQYEDKVFELIWWDEPMWKTKDLRMYLRMFDGEPIDWPVKGSHTVREDRQKIIMTTNKPKHELYSQIKRLLPVEEEALDRRIDCVDLGDREIHFLQQLIRHK